MTHTRGPWTRVPQTHGGDLIARRYETGNQFNPTGLRIVCFMASRRDSLTEDEANANLVEAAPDLLEAAQALESAETAHANCPDCDGEQIPELCETCFPLFDDARLKRRTAIAKAERRS